MKRRRCEMVVIELGCPSDNAAILGLGMPSVLKSFVCVSRFPELTVTEGMMSNKSNIHI